MLSRRWRAAALVAGGVATAAPATAQPASPMRSIQEGVYTAAQAERGHAHYESACLRCHGADLSGGGARPLVGEEFLRNWLGLPLDGLLAQMRTMPPSATAPLADAVYLDILSFVLERNGFPVGDEELQLAALGDVRVEGADGPQPVPNHTLVQVIGCLSPGPSASWRLTGASEPVRTRNPDPSTGDARREAEHRAAGQGSYALLYVFPSPDALVGHRVEVKGFLIRHEPDAGQATAEGIDALNVTSLGSLAPVCEP